MNRWLVPSSILTVVASAAVSHACSTCGGHNPAQSDPSGSPVVLADLGLTAPAHPGDMNNDGVVDLVDLNIVLNSFGSWDPGDCQDCEPPFDLSSLNDVLNYFGAVYPPESLAVVPEPTTAVVLSSVAALLVRRRRQ